MSLSRQMSKQASMARAASMGFPPTKSADNSGAYNTKPPIPWGVYNSEDGSNGLSRNQSVLTILPDKLHPQERIRRMKTPIPLPSTCAFDSWKLQCTTLF